MGRKPVKIPKSELKNLMGKYDTQNEIADVYDCSQATISNKIKEYELGASVRSKTERDPKIERPNYGYKKTKEKLLQKENETSETVGYDEVDIKIDTDIPIRLIPVADWHIGARYVAYSRLFEVVDLIESDPQTFTTINGDMIDNFTTSGYKGGRVEQELGVQEQKYDAENIVKRLTPSTLSILNGCFLKGTPIVADDYTMKPIETIEKVLGSKKEYKVKMHWNNNYTEDGIYKITYMGNSVYDIPVTGDHKLYALKREKLFCKKKNHSCKGIHCKSKSCKGCTTPIMNKPKKIQAKNLEKGDFLYISKPEDKNGDNFTIDDMKIFGWYLAEGSAIPEYNKTVFSFGEKDKKYAKEIKTIIEKNHSEKYKNISFNKRKNRHTIPLIIRGEKFTNWILELCGRYSYAKKISKKILNESNKKLYQLIDSFRLGDGHTRNIGISLHTVSEDLAWQLWNILLRLGIFASIREQDKNKMSESYINEIKVNHNYNDFQVYYKKKKRTKFRYGETDNGFFVPIKKIEKDSYVGYVKNLWIDSDEHMYRANGICVGNCHEEWSFLNDGFDFARYLSQHSKGYFMGHNGKINLTVGDITYGIYVTHNTKYNSSLNPGHGLSRSHEKITEFDIGIGAHVHTPHFEQRVVKNKIITLMICGSFKGQSRNASKKEYPLPYHMTPGLVLYPNERRVMGNIDYRRVDKYL